jgi:hypothetical protein
MIKRSTVLFLEFIAALAGNLIAGWIQQDVWQGIFTLPRLLGTAIGAALMLLAIVWLEKRFGGESQPRTRVDARRPKLSSSRVTHMTNQEEDGKYDVFISHASEDKDEFVRPLAEALTESGFSVWYDDFELEPGDSLRQAIDQGLVKSNYGIVVLSRAFFEQDWPQYELNGLFAKELHRDKVILPVWYDVEREDVLSYSPILADKFALRASSLNIEQIAERIAAVLRH